MRRRSLLVACGSCVAAIAGCAGDRREQGASSTPDHTENATRFRSAVEGNAERVQSASLNGTEWTVSYSTDACCGDPFESHQAALARNFSSAGPENGSLNATAFHECTNIYWRIPAELVQQHRSGEIDTETYVRRVQNTTSRESQC